MDDVDGEGDAGLMCFFCLFGDSSLCSEALAVDNGDVDSELDAEVDKSIACCCPASNKGSIAKYCW